MYEANEKPKHRQDFVHECEVLLDLHTALLTDIAGFLGFDPTRDIKTIHRRFRTEGISFLTVTLPAYGKLFLRAYNTGMFHGCMSFSTRRGRALPKFLSGLTSHLFDMNTGKLLKDPCYLHAWGLHQITTFLSKYEFESSDKKKVMMFDKMRETDAGLPNVILDNWGLAQTKLDALIDTAANLLEEVLSGLDLDDIIPRHGPGSTNEGKIEQYSKFEFRRGDELLDKFYPQGTYNVASGRLAAEKGGWGLVPWKSPEIPLCTSVSGVHIDRVLRTTITHAVHKDSRGPRIISAEAKELMWIQQGQNSAMVDFLENCPYTKGHINFTDQTINAKLALDGSQSGEWCTIDLKEASDRNSSALMARLLPSYVFARLWSSRSIATQITYPGGNSVEMFLRKFAPMGSAVCFPAEALVFWALSVSGVSAACKMTPKEVAKRIYVYGDDIIVPSEWYGTVTESLELVGLLVNHDKSFSAGPFRESCGMDAFLGVDITPVKLKKRMPKTKSNARDIVGWVKSANLIAKTCPTVSERMLGLVEALIGELPVVPEACGVLGREMKRYPLDNLPKTKERQLMYDTVDGEGFKMLKLDRSSFKPNLQGRVLKGWMLVSDQYVPPSKEFSEEHALLRWFSLKGHKPAVVENVRAFAKPYSERLERVTMVIS